VSLEFQWISKSNKQIVPVEFDDMQFRETWHFEALIWLRDFIVRTRGHITEADARTW